MTPEEHRALALVWNERFELLRSWVDPAIYAGLGLAAWTIGCVVTGNLRAALVSLRLQLFWLCVQLLHRAAGRYCVRRIQGHVESAVNHEERA